MDRIRILMLEPNRYRALLLQRALIAQIPASVVARFSGVADALDELSRAVYSAAIIVADAFSVSEAERLSALASDHRPGTLMLLTSPESSHQVLAHLSELPNSVTIDGATAPEEVVGQLVERLREFSSSAAPTRGDSSGYLSRLALSGE